MQKEAACLQACAEDYVVVCYAYGQVSSSNGEVLPCLLLELSPHGSIDTLARPGGIPVGMKVNAARWVIWTVTEVLDRNHSKNIIHRDLKSSNLLMFGDVSWPLSCVKLSDFGSARRIAHQADLAQSYLVGTAIFRAPEMREGYYHDCRVDI